MLTWERFSDDFFGRYFHFRPDEAIICGVRGYDHLLPDMGDYTYYAEKIFFESSLKRLREIDRRCLTQDERIDWRILEGRLILENYEFAQEDYRLYDPGFYLPFEHLYHLTVLPTNDPARNIIECLKETPHLISQGISNLSRSNADPPRLWTTMAIQTAESGVEFLRDLPNASVLAGTAENNQLIDMLAGATRAVKTFKEFLEREVLPRSDGSYAVGRDHFNLILQHKHFLPFNATQLLLIGGNLFHETKRELARCADKIAHGKSIDEATRMVQAQHPATCEEMFLKYREAVAAAREFVVAKGLVTFPPRERLEVVETPVFMRHEIPFAAYLNPPPSDPEQVGRYYVTPPASGDEFAEHNYFGILNTSVHESYPGHHLQLTRANSHTAARTLMRINEGWSSSVMYEGWALYCEQLMHDQGFLGKPEHEFIMLKDRLWRALRTIIDVKTQCGWMTYDEAADLMVRELAYPRSQAEADLNWYSQAPAIPMGYALGWHMITRLRKREEKRLGKRFSLRKFHDTFLSAGSIAPPLIIKRHFRD